MFHTEQFKKNNNKNTNLENVPRGTFSCQINYLNHCSTWKILLKRIQNFKNQKLSDTIIKNRKSKYSTSRIVPRGTILKIYNKGIKNDEKNLYKITNTKNKASTLNGKKISKQDKKILSSQSILNKIYLKMFHMEHFLTKLTDSNNVPRGTFFIKIILSVLIPHIAIMPSTLFYFQNTSTYSIIANLVAIPLATFIIMPLIILNFIFKMFHVEHLSAFLDFLLKKSIEILLKIGDYFSHLPFGYITTHQISNLSFSLMIFGLLWFLIWQKKWRFYGILIYTIGLFFSYQNNPPDFFIYENNNQIQIIAHRDDKYHGYFFNKNNFISKKILIKNNIESFSEIKNVPRGTFAFEQKNKKILFCKNKCDKKISDQGEGFDFKIILHDEKTENVPRGTFSYQVNKTVKSARLCSTWNILHIDLHKLNELGVHSIFIKKNRLVIKTGFDYIGNRPWNFNYND